MAKDDLTHSFEDMEGRSKQEASAENAARAFAGYTNNPGSDEPVDETTFSDLLGDLMHYAKEHEIDFDDALSTAERHFEAETDDPDELLRAIALT